MQPLVFTHTNDGKIISLRAYSNRVTISNSKNYKVMRELDFKDHETALFYAQKIAHFN